MFSQSTKNFFSFLLDIAKLALISLLIIIPIRAFVVQPFFVRGQSMTPTFHSGDYLVVDEISYHFRKPQRGEVIVFRYPENPDQYYIKRIIGLPGEKIEIKNSKITIYNESHPQGWTLNESSYLPFASTPGNEEIQLKANQYFVLGDNRSASFDSRRFGALKEKYIVGRVLIRAWPFEKAQAFLGPAYSN